MKPIIYILRVPLLERAFVRSFAVNVQKRVYFKLL